MFVCLLTAVSAADVTVAPKPDLKKDIDAAKAYCKGTLLKSELPEEDLALINNCSSCTKFKKIKREALETRCDLTLVKEDDSTLMVVPVYFNQFSFDTVTEKKAGAVYGKTDVDHEVRKVKTDLLMKIIRSKSDEIVRLCQKGKPFGEITVKQRTERTCEFLKIEKPESEKPKTAKDEDEDEDEEEEEEEEPGIEMVLDFPDFPFACTKDKCELSEGALKKTLETEVASFESQDCPSNSCDDLNCRLLPLQNQYSSRKQYTSWYKQSAGARIPIASRAAAIAKSAYSTDQKDATILKYYEKAKKASVKGDAENALEAARRAVVQVCLAHEMATQSWASKYWWVLLVAGVLVSGGVAAYLLI